MNTPPNTPLESPQSAPDPTPLPAPCPPPETAAAGQQGPPASPSRPCGACPFSRAVAPGALGGANPPEVFVGQAFAGIMWLPCHKLYDPNLPARDQSASKCGQCAGAAIFRANCDIPAVPGIHRLPPDHEAVFSSAAEFIAHHRRIPVWSASVRLARETPIDLARRELRKAGVRIHLIPKS
ncbi:hypothetical protein UFOVP783_45 [uncultured Caudovirales phage]|uniref:Uncharacterized protein n=1 Tax=uncultured Caudovirales phage TaxID=2100421 RepID=A0A6J5NYY6_9CAUD|nr:hypothetical protein UFOVP783_45 [uncultured Caudovirales phage]